MQAAAAPRPSQITRAGFVIWVPFWLSVGIALWFGLRNEPGPGAYLAAAAVGLAGIGSFVVLSALARQGGARPWLSDRLMLGCLCLGLVAAGGLIAGARSAMVAAPVLQFRYYGPIEGRVTGIDRSSRDLIRVTLDRVILHNVAPSRTPGKVRLSLMGGDDPPAPGEHVMLTGHLSPPPGPSDPEGFDFRRLAWFQGLGAVGYVRTPILRAGPAEQGGPMALHRLRMQLSQAIQDRIGGQPGAVSAALMTGDRSGIAEATNEVMRISSLYHIISISGLHMTMLAAFVYGTARFIGVGLLAVISLAGGRPPGFALHKIAALAALLASASYLWLSGGGVATERAFIMVAVMLGAILVDRRAISLRTVAIAAVIVLVLTPESLTSPSFHMSFSATIALVLMSTPWRAIAPHLPRWTHAALMLLLTSIFAGLATGPFAAASFGRISHYGLLANLLVVPVMGAAVMNMGVISVLLAPFGLEGISLWIMGWGAYWMIWVSEWISGIEGADLLVPLPPPIVLPALGAGMVLAALTRPQRLVWAGRKWVPPGMALGAMLLVAAFTIWLNTPRPDVLISAEGDAVGIMTAGGRAVSKPSGGAFAIRNWLADDGDHALQVEAAARPIWQGAANMRIATLGGSPQDWRIIHATGKFDHEALRGECRARTIIVTNATFQTGRAVPPCLILDQDALRQHGAIAIRMGGAGPRIVSTAAVKGDRRWLPAPPPTPPMLPAAGDGAVLARDFSQSPPIFAASSLQTRPSSAIQLRQATFSISSAP